MWLINLLLNFKGHLLRGCAYTNSAIVALCTTFNLRFNLSSSDEEIEFNPDYSMLPCLCEIRRRISSFLPSHYCINRRQYIMNYFVAHDYSVVIGFVCSLFTKMFILYFLSFLSLK